MSQNPGERVLVDAPYWFALGSSVDRLEDRLPRGLTFLASRSALLRSLATAWTGRRHGLVAVDWGAPGRALALWMSLVGANRRLIYLNFHVSLDGRSRIGWVTRLALRRSALAVQALSLDDCVQYAERLGLGAERVRYVPYPWRRDRETATPPKRRTGRTVMASGYARCDWETLFAAAREASWKLVVVCGERDLARVRALNATVGAEVHCEIPRERHRELLDGAAVYVIPVRDEGVSVGHVRLRTANEAGVPVVCAAIRSMAEYVLDEVTGLKYPPGDADALRRSVDGMLADPGRAQALAQGAAERSKRWDQVHAFVAQRSMLEVALGHPPDPDVLSPPVEAEVAKEVPGAEAFLD